MRRMFSRAEDRLEEILCSGEYDAVLCTHVFAGVMMTQLRQRGKNPLQTWFLATDYGCSPGVGTLEVDGWLIPDRDLAAEFCARGVPRGRLIATGIPVRQAIIRSEPKAQAKAKEGVSPEKAHIVMMCGSMGCGPMEEVTGFLSGQLENAELTVVCGSNEKLRQRLLRKHAAHPNIHIRGYVENISRLLDSADVMLTKPGGISTTECAVKGIPMVFIHAVAGCETDNLRFFQQMGGAVSAETPRELARISCRLLQDQKRQQEMKQALRNKNYAAAAKTIAELITESQRTCQCG